MFSFSSMISTMVLFVFSFDLALLSLNVIRCHVLIVSLEWRRIIKWTNNCKDDGQIRSLRLTITDNWRTMTMSTKIDLIAPSPSFLLDIDDLFHWGFSINDQRWSAMKMIDRMRRKTKRKIFFSIVSSQSMKIFSTLRFSFFKQKNVPLRSLSS